jgi:hypothetical protein
MLYDLTWLETNKNFPPQQEQARMQRYADNLAYFNTKETAALREYSKRIARVINNFSEVVAFPLIFNYQKLMSLKMADLVCGESPKLSTKKSDETDILTLVQSDIDFDAKIYTTTIDVSRYGDAVWRIYLSENDKYDFTVWDPNQWYPIVINDGTNRIRSHVLCWIDEIPIGPNVYRYELTAQDHHVGYYEEYKYHMNSKTGVIGTKISGPTRYDTGLKVNAVMHVKAYSTSDTIYGHDDYEAIDSIVKELETRCAQISSILDKHADPSLTGPTSLLKINKTTGEPEFHRGKFYAVTQGDMLPQYLTWNGQLDAAFKQIDVLLNQLFILSELGAAIVGDKGADGQAVSAEAMRYKLVTPLNKARRVSNALTLASRKLISTITTRGYEKVIEAKAITVEWRDGLPDDPRAILEYAKIACGEDKIMPLATAISLILGKTTEEAEAWIKAIDERTQHLAEMDQKMSLSPVDESHKPGPNTGTTPSKKGSEGISNFGSPKNA